MKDKKATKKSKKQTTKRPNRKRQTRTVTNNTTSDVTADVTNTLPEVSPEVPPKNNIKPLPNPPDPSLRSGSAPAEKPKPAARGSRLPADWFPDRDGRQLAIDLLGQASADSEFQKFSDYWLSQPGARGVKADWQATWRNWVRRASENARASPRGPPGQRRTGGDLLAQIAFGGDFGNEPAPYDTRQDQRISAPGAGFSRTIDADFFPDEPVPIRR